MIDLHCHVLPAIDDGARDMDDALAMARQAEADGIAVICATPHIRRDHDVRIHELDGRIAELQTAIDAAGIAVRIERGGEVAEPILESLTDDELRTVALGGRWVLLEPAAGPIGEDLVTGVAHLHERGFGAIVAHPERHAASDLEDWLAKMHEPGVSTKGPRQSIRLISVETGRSSTTWKYVVLGLVVVALIGGGVFLVARRRRLSTTA